MINNWNGKVPGQMQVLMTCHRDKTVSIVSRAFIPGVNRNNKFDLTVSATDFKSTVEELAGRLSRLPEMEFPNTSTASKVVLLINFCADRDLGVFVPDLRNLESIPRSESSLRVARLCTILESGCLYGLSDELKKRLPQAARHRFVPDDCHHGLSSYWPNAWSGCIFGDWRKHPINKTVSSFILQEIDKYLSQKRYSEAEVVAKNLAFSYFSIMHPPAPPSVYVPSYREPQFTIKDIQSYQVSAEQAVNRPLP